MSGDCFPHPDREMQVINRENETISHHYTHHVLLMAAIPVICAFIGTTQIGWNFGDGTILKLSWFTGLALAVLFYGRYAGWGRGDGAGHLVDGAQLPAASVTCALAWSSRATFATPLFLSGLVALYPLVWLCALVGTVALFYTGYLLYLGIPSFLNINKEEGLSFSSSTLAIGVLVLEVLLALTVILWGYGYRLF
ncbi:inner membrane protein [Escherichia coli]|uniref:Inner membrane protein n=1 Tax=Escherichia coli TaxID=562 RepID=A0A2X3LW19_ECOLX|nr:inner membrane protein [Escherichia coli]